MIRLLALSFLLGLLFATAARADAALASRLDLDLSQAQSLTSLEASYRREFASLRQLHNREARALRRARIANDAAEIQRLDLVVEGLRVQLADLRDTQDARIGGLLRPEQQPLFEAYVAERRQMRGSSRDERLFD